MGNLEKMRKLRQRRATENNKRNFSNLRDIYYDFEMGDNRIRLCDEFLEVRTHFIAPAPKRNDRGLCQAEAFKGDDRIPMVINCPDWDLEKEEKKPESEWTCPICKLNRIANQILEEGPDEEETDFFKKLRSQARARAALKWNILDRANPYITKKEGDSEEKVLGYKIATIGMEAYDDIEGIFEQTGMDISDAEEGVDIIVSKVKGKMRVEYSAKAAMDMSVKPPTVAMTPLTDEEQAAEMHRLLERCGRQTEPQKIIDALHGDYRDLLEMNLDDDEADAEPEVEETPAEPEPPKAAPKKARKSEPEDQVDEVDEEDIDDEDDDPLAGTSSKKK
jgi:hypothetical protein